MKVRFRDDHTVNGEAFTKGQETELFDALAQRLWNEGVIEPADQIARARLEANRPGRPVRQTRRRVLNPKTGEWEWPK